jgi:hypothetical protein
MNSRSSDFVAACASASASLKSHTCPASLWTDYPTPARQPPSRRHPIAEPSPISETCPISRRSDAKVGQQVERLARPGSQTLTRPDLDAMCHAFERDNRRATRWAWRVTGLNPIAPTLIPLLAMLPRASTRFRRRNTKLRGSRPTPSVTTTGREGRDERQKVVNGGMPVRLHVKRLLPGHFPPLLVLAIHAISNPAKIEVGAAKAATRDRQ